MMHFNVYVLALLTLGGMAKHVEILERFLAPLITPSPASKIELPSGYNNQASDFPVEDLIKDSYIVVFKKGLREGRIQKHKRIVQKLWIQDTQQRLQTGSFEHVDLFKGIEHHLDIGENFRAYSVHLPETLINMIRTLPGVEYVERECQTSIDETFYNSRTVPAAEGDFGSASGVRFQHNAPWGLSRLSQRAPLEYDDQTYLYKQESGLGVDVYIIDTGVNCEHVEFEGRCKQGTTFGAETGDDLMGHGSHVAGLVSSRTFGVAKSSNIISVKVFNSRGTVRTGDFLAGLQWTFKSVKAKESEAETDRNSKYKGSVINISITWEKKINAIDQAVQSAIQSGLHIVIAAGNSNQDACEKSPARVHEAITVGASTPADERAFFSNHGACVTVFAPGLEIWSVDNRDKTSAKLDSGTSMASPYVAGLAAYFLSIYPQGLDLDKLDLSLLTEMLADRVSSTVHLDSLLSHKISSLRPIQIALRKLRKTLVFGLPRWSPAGVGSKLSPQVLKEVVIRLSTPGIISGIDQQTPNYLAYNNASTSN